MNVAPKKPHWAGIFAGLMSLLGFVAANSQAIASIVPPKISDAVLVAGVVIQAITKPVHAGDTDIVPATRVTP